MSEFSGSLAYGEDGEHAVARKLMERGTALLPVFQFENHSRAPAVLYQVDAEDAAFIAPDLTCFKAGRVFFVEVKRKRSWVHWNGRRETGFDERLFRQYMELERTTGVPVWCFFVHEIEEPTGVFVARLAALAPSLRVWNGRVGTARHTRGDGSKQKPLALFDASVLRRLWTIDDLRLTLPADRREADAEDRRLRLLSGGRR